MVRLSRTAVSVRAGDKMTQPLKVTVKRSQWLRGEGHDSSCLLRSSDGNMCCLGFACIAADLSQKNIRDVRSVDMLNRSIIPKPLCGLVDPCIYRPISTRITSSVIAMELMGINDDTYTTDDKRETALRKLGKKVGIEFTFVD